MLCIKRLVIYMNKNKYGRKVLSLTEFNLKAELEDWFEKLLGLAI